MKNSVFILIALTFLSLWFAFSLQVRVIRLQNQLSDKNIEINSLTKRSEKLTNDVYKYKLASIKNHDLYLRRDADLSACLVDIESCHNEIANANN